MLSPRVLVPGPLSRANPDGAVDGSEAFDDVASRWVNLVFGVLGIVIVACIVLSRQVGTHPLYDVIWAEDGSVFLAQALDQGWLGDLFEPYSGYMQLIPRVIGALAAATPLEDAARVWAGVSSLLIAGVAAYVYRASSALYDSVLSRMALASLVIVHPLAGEIVANAANLHWYLMFAAFFALATQPITTSFAVTSAAVVLAASLSNPLSALLLPVGLITNLARRTRTTMVVFGAFLVGLAVQAAIVLSSTGAARSSESSLVDLPAIFAGRVVGGLIFGDVVLGRFWVRFGPLMALIASVAVVVALTAGARALPRSRKSLAWQAMGVAVAFFVVPLLLRGTAGLRPTTGMPFPLDGARYMVIPALLLAAVGIPALTTFSAKRPWSRVLVKLAVLWMAAIVLINFAINPRAAGPSWLDEVAAARTECASSSLETPVKLTIAPPSGNWFVEVTCGQLQPR